MTGWTLIELMFATTLAALLAGISMPLLATGLDRSRTEAAARYLASPERSSSQLPLPASTASQMSTAKHRAPSRSQTSE